MPYHEWAGSSKAGQAGDGGAPVRKTLPAWPSATLFPRSSIPGGCKTITEKTSAAAAAADAGLVFYNYSGHRSA